MAKQVQERAVERSGDATGTGEVTGLALAETDDGELLTVGFDQLVNQPDVSIVKTIKIGDPDLGGKPAYVGLVLGPGEDVATSLPDGKGGLIEGNLHTWSCHPCKLSLEEDGKTVKWTPILNITHVIIAPHQINAAIARIFKSAEQDNKVGMFAARWNGKMSIKGGARQLNDYDVLERYVPKASN